MKKQLILLATTAICILLMVGMTACGEDQNAEQANEDTTTAEEPAENLSQDEMTAKLIGAWMPADGLDGSAFSFGYMTDQGLSADPDSGEFCIQEKYVKYDGGGATTVTCEADNGKMTFTTYLSEYSAGGEIGNEGVVEVENITDHTATINGAPYEKLTDDPADPEMIVNKTIDSRLASIVAGEWGTDDGAILLKLNEDGTMHYKNAGVDADGTWKSDGSMYITLDYTDPNTNEAGNDAYYYEVDNDWMSGTGMSADEVVLLRKKPMKTCPRCDSDNIVRVLTSSMILAVPELRKEVKEGRAIVCTACCGTGSSRTFKCKSCKLQWDENMEDDIRNARSDR